MCAASAPGVNHGRPGLRTPPVPLAIALLTGVGYFLGAYLGVHYTLMPEGIAIVWPPNGVLLAALLLRPQREWPWYLAAIVPAEVLADVPAFTVSQAIAFAAINGSEALLAAWLLRGRGGPAFTLARLREVMRFGLFAVLLASMAAAVLGATVYQHIKLDDTSYWAFWRIWWFGDALGLLLVTPLIIGWADSRSAPRAQPRRVAEAAALAAATLAAGFIVFGGVVDRSHVPVSALLTLPLPVWAAIRFGLHGAASVTAALAVFAVAEATRGASMFRVFDQATAVILLQEFIAILAFSSLALAALLRELRERSATLEQRVAERTHELVEANARLEALAVTDALTGLHNRRHFMERAAETLAQSCRHGHPMSIVMMDVDRFKQINDNCGHDAGDAVLRRIAATCRQQLRDGDLAARYGGEEFVLMLPATDTRGAQAIAERIRCAVAGLEVECRGAALPVSASFGVAERLPGEEDIGALLIRADEALYAAKHHGRNRVECAEGPMAQQAGSILPS